MVLSSQFKDNSLFHSLSLSTVYFVNGRSIVPTIDSPNMMYLEALWYEIFARVFTGLFLSLSSVGEARADFAKRKIQLSGITKRFAFLNLICFQELRGLSFAFVYFDLTDPGPFIILGRRRKELFFSIAI